MDEFEKLKQENEELKKQIRSLQLLLRQKTDELLAHYSSYAKKQWQYEQDYLPYPDHDRDD